jgi:starch phosphorylase
MATFQTLSVLPTLPERIQNLKDLAYSFWCSWNPEAENLFKQLNPRLWNAVQYNPAKFLRYISQRRLDSASKNQEFLKEYDRIVASYKQHKEASLLWFKKTYGDTAKPDFQIGYFSAEFGLHESFPMYSGGLGILAGDFIKSCSDLGIPLVAVGILYQNGYFEQKLNREGWQEAVYHHYSFMDMPIEPIKNDFGEEIKINVDFPNGTIIAKVWKASVMNTVLLLLDTNVPENIPENREITAKLYGGDQDMRVRQELVLGIGGVRALRACGYQPSVWHMNEGHSVFMALERIRELVEKEAMTFQQAAEIVRSSTVFTTHTPVPAGNDAFHYGLIEKYFFSYWVRMKISKEAFLDLGTAPDEEGHGMFNLTILALNLCAWKNGVSRLHGHVSRNLWKHNWVGIPAEEIPISYVTNGVHSETWMNPRIRELYNHYLPEWPDKLLDTSYWSRIDQIPDRELWDVTRQMKKEMIAFIHQRVSEQRSRYGETIEQLREIEGIFDENTLTIGFARRFATYKRATLILKNIERFKRIINNPDRPVQMIFAGKAHPADRPGQELIKQIYEVSRSPDFKNRIVFLENYNMEVARNLVSGVDIWLNTPRRPHEASGTSGQKVPVNGGINFSVMDGWWEEAYNEKNGWIIGDNREYTDTVIQDMVDAVSFYDTLEKDIVAKYYARNQEGIPIEFLSMMKHSMKTVIPQFNTHRMARDYVDQLYFPAYAFGETMQEKRYENGKSIAHWKSHISKEWNAVKIQANSVRRNEEEIPANLELEMSATVYLAEIDPKDVVVELYFERYNVMGELEGTDTFPMCLDMETLHHTYVFKGKFRLSERGNYRYSIRALPHHPALPHKFDTGLVRWIGDA